MISQKGIRTEIVADEWCNTKEDIFLFLDQQAVGQGKPCPICLAECREAITILGGAL
jgi:hypothetical protein